MVLQLKQRALPGWTCLVMIVENVLSELRRARLARGRHSQTQLRRVGLWPRSCIVHAALQLLLPRVEQRRGQLRVAYLREIQRAALGLVDVRGAADGVVDDGLLLDLPGGLEHGFRGRAEVGVVGNRAAVLDQVTLKVGVIRLPELLLQDLVRDRERAGKRAPCVQVRRDRIHALGVAQDLRRGRRGHDGGEQAVPHAVRHHVALEAVPVERRVGRGAREVERELAGGGGGTVERLVAPVALGEVHGFVHGGVVDLRKKNHI